MGSKKASQQGVAHFGILLLLVIAAIAFVGYKLEQNRKDSSPVAAATRSTQAVQTIPTITSKADLNTVQSTLDSQNVDGDLNPDSFNSDVSSLQ